jgi:hypothetical protein
MEVDHRTEVSWDHDWETSYRMNGRHMIQFLVMDNAGNTSEDTVTLDVENGTPFIFWPIKILTDTPFPSPTPAMIPVGLPTAALPGPTAEFIPAPSPTPEAMPTRALSEPPAEVYAVPSQASATPVVPSQTPTRQPQRTVTTRAGVSSWKLYAIAAGLFAVFGLTFALDRRPAAYRKTASILLGIMKNNQHKE